MEWCWRGLFSTPHLFFAFNCNWLRIPDTHSLQTTDRSQIYLIMRNQSFDQYSITDFPILDSNKLYCNDFIVWDLSIATEHYLWHCAGIEIRKHHLSSQCFHAGNQFWRRMLPPTAYNMAAAWSVHGSESGQPLSSAHYVIPAIYLQRNLVVQRQEWLNSSHPLEELWGTV